MRAKTLGEILKVADLKPLNEENFDDYYVNCSSSRGYDATEQLKSMLISLKDNPQRVLFTGHRGCGKSTELVRLSRELENDFFTVKFSVLDVLDLNSIGYVDIMFEAMRQLYDKAADEGVKLKSGLLDNIFGWLSTIEVQEIKDKSKEFGGSAGAKLKALKLLFADVNARFKYVGQTKEKITTFFDRRFAELIIHCTTLINEINSKLKHKPILIIIEDLDKTNLEKAKEIFLDHAGQITALNCHMIFTLPISLRYSPDFPAIESYFKKTCDLPMTKISHADGKKYSEGRELLGQIIEKRVDLKLFEHGVMDKLIEMSGGSLRDLMRILQESALFAMGSGGGKINMTAIDQGLVELKKSFRYCLTEKREGNKVVIGVEDYDKKLDDVSRHKKAPNQDQALMDLLHSRCVLRYENGNPWYDIHPLVKEIMDERKENRAN